MFDEKQYNREWKARNKDRVKATQKAWREENKAILKERERLRHIKFRSARCAASRAAYHADPEKARRYRYKKWYGMSDADYDLFVQIKNCHLCNNDKLPLRVDHCHETGRVRGFICTPCNTGLGKLGDNIEGLERALGYLRGKNN